MKYDEDQERTHRLTLQVTYHLGLQDVSSSAIADPGAAAPCTALRVCVHQVMGLPHTPVTPSPIWVCLLRGAPVIYTCLSFTEGPIEEETYNVDHCFYHV